MNIEKFNSAPLNQRMVKDDRIYNDSKGRPVGIACKVNRVTNSVVVPADIPILTPEDKRNMDKIFNRCFESGMKFVQSKK